MLKIFNRKIWTWTFFGFGTIFAIALSGSQVANDNAMALNNALGIKTTQAVGGGDSYFTRDFANDRSALKAHIKEVAEQTEAEGLCLLENKANALPLLEGSRKVSLFGTASYAFNYSTSGSSSMGTTTDSYPTLVAAFEANGFTVNPTLKNFYESADAKAYGRVEIGNYKINELPYANIGVTELNSVAQYGDAAIVIFARNSGEGKDLTTIGSDGEDGSYLSIHAEEENLLKGLTSLKGEGKLSKIIVLLNSSNPMSLEFMKRDGISVDALLWVGNVGSYGISAIPKALSGLVNPSGRLSDTFVYDLYSSPAMASWTLSATKSFSQPYSNYKPKDKETFNTSNRVYGVYNEGIYVGYRYYETRYYDVVSARANAGDFVYADKVAYPFGHGLSYGEFSYSDFALSQSEDGKGFVISVKVTNNSDTYNGKHAVQVYLQKPYTDYDIANGVEKSAVELVGFEKTASLAPHAEETVQVKVEKERLKSYDANQAKTYILDAGDYLFTVAKDAHAATDNFLAKNSFGGSGNASMVSAFHVDALDATTYAKSYQTGYAITNQLDHADPNKYAGLNNPNTVKYVSRSNWAGTFPSEVNSIAVADGQMKADNLGNYDFPSTDQAMPKYGQSSSLKAGDLHGLAWDAPEWTTFMDSMTYADQVELICNGNMATTGNLANAYGLPETKAADGPTMVTKSVTDSSFPCEGIWASTFNKELVKQIGDALAEDCLECEVHSLYAPGVNIHRAPFIGRAAEYFSEDPLLSGEMCAYEIQGLQGKGVIAHVKHFAFNDQETDRNGIAIWLNEQAAREIYLLPFEYAVSEDKGFSHVVMNSFNRIGVIWAGADKNLQLNILQNEWGFKGYTITDMAQSDGSIYMLLRDGFAGGTNLFMKSASSDDLAMMDSMKNDAYFANMVRDSAKRIIYNITNYSVNMVPGEIVSVTPWWSVLLTTLTIVSGVLMGGSLAMAAFCILKSMKEQ